MNQHFGFRVTAFDPNGHEKCDTFEIRGVAQEHARRLFSQGWTGVRCQEVRAKFDPFATEAGEDLIHMEFHIHMIGA